MNKRTITAAFVVTAAAAFVPATLVQASTAGAVARHYQGSQYSAAYLGNEQGTPTGESASLLAEANAALLARRLVPSVKTVSSPPSEANEPGTANGESGPELAAANAGLARLGK